MSEVILDCFQTCCAEISNLIRNNNCNQLGKLSGNSNSSQDDVKHLDMLSNSIISKTLSMCPVVRGYASEEEDKVVWTSFKQAPYFVVFDPLDGSSNIDVNQPIGTIFGIFKGNNIKNGHDLCLAGYALYSPATQMIIAKKNDLMEDEHAGVRCLQLYQDNVWHSVQINRFEQIDKMYSINESNRFRWPDWIREWVDNEIKKNKTQRWIGSLVADGHRTLIKGGVFSYPADSKNKTGKLRLVYEAYPFALIFSLAGGKAVDNRLNNILDIPFPWDNIHQKTGLFLGDSKSIDGLEVFLSGKNKDNLSQ